MPAKVVSLGKTVVVKPFDDACVEPNDRPPVSFTSCFLYTDLQSGKPIGWLNGHVFDFSVFQLLLEG